MKTWLWAVIALAAVFFGGWLLGRHYAQPEIVETTRIDTVFYEKPTQISTSDITVSVNVPKLVFARDEPVTIRNGLDSVVKSYLNTDSVRMNVTVRTLEYRDSTYYARVVGPVVGNLSPRLDFIETYNTTKTTTQIIKQPRKFLSLAAIVGTDYAKDGWSPYVEVGLSADLRFATLTATAGVDNAFKTPEPRIGIEMGIPLWSL